MQSFVKVPSIGLLKFEDKTLVNGPMITVTLTTLASRPRISRNYANNLISLGEHCPVLRASASFVYCATTNRFSQPARKSLRMYGQIRESTKSSCRVRGPLRLQALYGR